MTTQTYSKIVTKGIDYSQLRIVVEDYLDDTADFDVDYIVSDAGAAIYRAALDADDPHMEFDWDCVDLDAIVQAHQIG